MRITHAHIILLKQGLGINAVSDFVNQGYIVSGMPNLQDCALTSYNTILSCRTKWRHVQTVSSIKKKEQILFWKPYKMFYNGWMLKAVLQRSIRDIYRTLWKKQNIKTWSEGADTWSSSGEVPEWQNRHIQYTKLQYLQYVSICTWTCKYIFS